MANRWSWSIFILFLISQPILTQNTINKWNLTNNKKVNDVDGTMNQQLKSNYFNRQFDIIGLNDVGLKQAATNINNNNNGRDYVKSNKFENIELDGYDVKQESTVKENKKTTSAGTKRQNKYGMEKDFDDEEFVYKDADTPHSRKKRLIWVTDDGRLALPPGTSLSISPTIALPFVRHPPDGFFSNMSISLPITIDFDKLGLTDNQNPLGELPPIFARSMGRAAGSILNDYISNYLHFRRKRDLSDNSGSNYASKDKIISDNKIKITTTRINDIPNKITNEELKIPKLPEQHQHAFHGGERALLYIAVEDFISNFGLNGKACLLRTICEVHSKSLGQLGLFGEMLKLFFTASRSPFSNFLDEYVSAEKTGEGKEGPGECFPYYKDCPKSLFKLQENRYSGETTENEHNDNENEFVARQPIVNLNLNKFNTNKYNLNKRRTSSNDNNINNINNIDSKINIKSGRIVM